MGCNRRQCPSLSLSSPPPVHPLNRWSKIMNAFTPILLITACFVATAMGNLVARDHPHLIDPQSGKANPRWKEEIHKQSWRKAWVEGENNREESDYYFEAWLRLKFAEKLDPQERLEQVQASLEVLEGLGSRSPEWKPSVLAFRIKSTKSLMKELTELQGQPGGAGEPATRSE